MHDLTIVTSTTFSNWEPGYMDTRSHLIGKSSHIAELRAELPKLASNLRAQLFENFILYAGLRKIPVVTCDLGTPNEFLLELKKKYREYSDGFDGFHWFKQSECVKTRAGARYEAILFVSERQDTRANGYIMMDSEKGQFVSEAQQISLELLESNASYGVLGRKDWIFDEDYPWVQARLERGLNSFANKRLSDLGLISPEDTPDWLNGTRFFDEKAVTAMLKNPPAGNKFMDYYWYLFKFQIGSLKNGDEVSFKKGNQRYYLRQAEVESVIDSGDYLGKRFDQFSAILPDLNDEFVVSKKEYKVFLHDFSIALRSEAKKHTKLNEDEYGYLNLEGLQILNERTNTWLNEKNIGVKSEGYDTPLGRRL